MQEVLLMAIFHSNWYQTCHATDNETIYMKQVFSVIGHRNHRIVNFEKRKNIN
jgi:hypothetical protein